MGHKWALNSRHLVFKKLLSEMLYFHQEQNYRYTPKMWVEKIFLYIYTYINHMDNRKRPPKSRVLFKEHHVIIVYIIRHYSRVHAIFL